MVSHLQTKVTKTFLQGQLARYGECFSDAGAQSQGFVAAVAVVEASWLLLDVESGPLQVVIPELEYLCVPPVPPYPVYSAP